MESMNTVNRKNVLITGANGGIGRAVAESLPAEEQGVRE